MKYEVKSAGAEDADIKTQIAEALAPAAEAVRALRSKVEDIEASVKKTGTADVITRLEVSNIEAKAFGRIDDLNQKLTAAVEREKELKSDLERVEALLHRANLRGGGDESKSLARDWVDAMRIHFTKPQDMTDAHHKAIAAAAASVKSLGVSPSEAGGFLAPVDFVREILKDVTLLSPMRSLVRVRNTAARSTEIPRRNGRAAARWAGEVETRTETTGLSYGNFDVPNHEIYAMIDISNQMLEDSAFDMETEIREEASDQFAVAEGAAIISGSGVGQPEGLLTASGVGETVSGVATAIGNATVGADALLTLKHSVPSAYAANGRWVFNRATLGAIRKLKDSNGEYLWNIESLGLGQPLTLDGDPFVEAPDMPDIAAGSYPLMYGDFRRAYTLIDRIGMDFLRDPYTKATQGKVGFLFRRRLGGKVSMTSAYRKLKIAAS